MKRFENFKHEMVRQGIPVEDANGRGFQERPRHVIIEDEENNLKNEEERKLQGFYDFINHKLNIDIDKSKILGSGAFGEVYDIGNNRALKFTKDNVSNQHRIMNKNIDGVVKVYSTGLIRVPKRFLSEDGIMDFENTWIFSENGKIGYIIMEKLERDASIDIEKYVVSPLRDFLNFQFKSGNPIEYSEELKFLYDNNDKEIIEMFEDYLEINFEGGDKYETSIKLLHSLINIFDNVKKYYNWVDIHTGQFGYDKSGNLKAFDLSGKTEDEDSFKKHDPKNYIREKNIMMFESFQSQKEIGKLATDILTIIGHNTFDEMNDFFENKGKKFLENGKFSKEEMFKMRGFHRMYFKYFPKDKLEKYNVLKDFITNYPLSVAIDILGKYNKDNGTFTQHGEFGTPEIFVYIEKELMDKISSEYASGKIYDKHAMYSELHYSCYSTLMHELQHAYDSYRSDHKALKRSRQYEYDLNRKNRILQKDIETLSDKDREFIMSQNKEYLNLKHEIDARFTQAIEKTHFYDIGKDENRNFVKVIQPWEKVYGSFKNNMRGWDILSDEDKKRLSRKLGQFYIKYKEELNNK